MLLKYIEANIEHKSKHYKFSKNELEFDEDQCKIILPKQYVKDDIENYECFIYSILDNMVKAKIYSSQSNAERALKNNILNGTMVITYCTDISKCNNKYSWGYSKDVKTKEDVEKYCSGIRYYYDFNTKKLDRYELYGDLILGDEIPRDESYYKN